MADSSMNDAGDPSSVPGPSMPNSAIPPQPNTPPPFRRAISEDYQRHEQSFEVGYVYSEEMLLHASIHGHPEAPERISVIKHELEETRLLKKMIQIPIRHAKRSEVLLVHSADLWDKVEAIQFMTAEDIEQSESFYDGLSLYVSPGTTNAALLSCGGVIEACLAVAGNKLEKSFAIVRPPGHHAEPEEHMGFCLFNNVAVAAKVVQKVTRIKRIMILDWDVHHGNGTQRAFEDDPSVLYISLHRYENGTFYPCGSYGGLESCGKGAGAGYSVNIPWSGAGVGDADYLHAFAKIVMPIATEFAPELVIISAGFDAAEGDPIGQCQVTPTGYAHMTYMLSRLAGGKLVVALEGGYYTEALAVCAAAVTRVLLGKTPPELPELLATDAGTEVVYHVALQQSKYWSNIDPKASQPREEVEALTYTIPDILKAHRQHDLYTNFGMFQVPLIDNVFEEALGTQVMCTHDMLFNKKLVVFVHEFGDLRYELRSSVECDVDLELSYLIDSSRRMMGIVKSEGYSLLDVNLFPKSGRLSTRLPKDELGRDVVAYLWDNFIQLSEAEQIVLIGHGAACAAIMSLVNKRFANVQQSVKLVIQVVGHAYRPAVPEDDHRPWYKTHSHLIVPSSHWVLGTEGKAKNNYKRHKKIDCVWVDHSVTLLSRAMDRIQERLQDVLSDVTG